MHASPVRRGTPIAAHAAGSRDAGPARLLAALAHPAGSRDTRRARVHLLPPFAPTLAPWSVGNGDTDRGARAPARVLTIGARCCSTAEHDKPRHTRQIPCPLPPKYAPNR